MDGKATRFWTLFQGDTKRKCPTWCRTSTDGSGSEDLNSFVGLRRELIIPTAFRATWRHWKHTTNPQRISWTCWIFSSNVMRIYWILLVSLQLNPGLISEECVCFHRKNMLTTLTGVSISPLHAQISPMHLRSAPDGLKIFGGQPIGTSGTRHPIKAKWLPQVCTKINGCCSASPHPRVWSTLAPWSSRNSWIHPVSSIFKWFLLLLRYCFNQISSDFYPNWLDCIERITRYPINQPASSPVVARVCQNTWEATVFALWIA